MILRFIKNMSPRMANVFTKITSILIITVISSLVLCLLFAVISNFASITFFSSLAGVSIIIFLITVFILFFIVIVLSLFLVIDAIKRDGVIKLLNRLLPSFLGSYAFFIIILGLKSKDLELLDALLKTLIITFMVFVYQEIENFTKQLSAENPTDDQE